MYTNILDETWDLYSDYLHGEKTGLLGVVSQRRLGKQACEALQSSFAQLGYGKAACTFVVLEGEGAASREESDARALPVLSGRELMAAVEGLDPLLLVITDKAAASSVADAYHQPIDLDKRSRVFGREVRAFSSFESMLDDSRSKQQAWALLKTLPKLEA